MATHRELQRLKQEENTLMNIASKISDQLHRLQVEELSLRSHLNVTSIKRETPVDDVTGNAESSELNKESNEDQVEKEFVAVDLSVPGHGYRHEDLDEEEEEEEDESDEKYDQLIAYIDEITEEQEGTKRDKR